MKKTFLLLISLFTTVTSFAHQFSCSNFYLDGFAGGNFVPSIEKHDVRCDFDSGYAMGAGLGYRFTPFFCLGTEVSYRENKIDGLKVEDVYLRVSGNLRSVSTMLNGLIEMPLLDGCIVPYCGLGLGHQWKDFQIKLQPIATQDGIYVFDRATFNFHGPAYQGIMGVNFIVLEKSRFGAEYRYLNHFHSDPGGHNTGNNTVSLKLTSYF